MIGQFIIDNLPMILSTLGASGFGLGYLFERNKRRIEQRKDTADALKSMQEAYDIFTNDYIQKYNIMKEDISTLKLELKNVYEQLASEKLKNKTLEYQIESLKIELAKYINTNKNR